MFDGKEETHWSSDQGSTQFVSLFFQSPIKFREFKIQFQGGFAARELRLILETADGAKGYSETFMSRDTIQVQSFQLKSRVEDVTSALFVFEESTDFFGRIVIYNLEVYD